MEDLRLLAHLGEVRDQEVPTVTFERLAQPKIRWRSQHEIMQWLNSIGDWRDKLIAKLMYQTGMRREEVVNLKIWNLPERSGLDLSRPEASFTIIGKGRKKRLIYLATRSLLEIYDYIKTERALLVRGAGEKTDNIFVGRALRRERDRSRGIHACVIVAGGGCAVCLLDTGAAGN